MAISPRIEAVEIMKEGKKSRGLSKESTMSVY
jgi:hypothetical protein